MGQRAAKIQAVKVGDLEKILPRCTIRTIPHCVLLYLIPFEEDASDFLIFWSTHMSQIGERKKIEILRWPSEIAC